MISYPVYKLIHLVGIFLILVSLAGAALHTALGGERVHPWKRKVALTHGIGMLVALVGGFGLMARLGIPHGNWPLWIWGKLGVWLALGGSIAIVRRSRQGAAAMWLGMVALAGLSAYLAIFKPF